jgi:hypothetical protein
VLLDAIQLLGYSASDVAELAGLDEQPANTSATAVAARSRLTTGLRDSMSTDASCCPAESYVSPKYPS